jgi:hypothetical protein
MKRKTFRKQQASWKILEDRFFASFLEESNTFTSQESFFELETPLFCPNKLL